MREARECESESESGSGGKSDTSWDRLVTNGLGIDLINR